MTPAEQLNPQYWNAERIERVRKASPRTFTMHINNEFGGAENALLSKPELDAVMQAELPDGMVWNGQAFAGIDTSKGRTDGDGTCVVIAFYAEAREKRRERWLMHPGTSIPLTPARDAYGRIIFDEMPVGKILRIAEVFGFEGEGVRGMSIVDLCAAIAPRCHRWGVKTIYGDDYESMGYGGYLSQHGLGLHSYKWSAESKESAIGGTLRRLVRERSISIVPHAELRRELLSIREVPRAGGRWGYETNGLDYASALISVCHALNDPDVVGSVSAPSIRIHDAPHAAHRGGKTIVAGR